MGENSFDPHQIGVEAYLDDAIYPVLVADADGAPPDGNNDYVCHFPAGELPPADAFWSITNWLPAPRGPLGITMRIYAPRPEALDGRWKPPPVGRALSRRATCLRRRARAGGRRRRRRGGRGG